MQCMYLLMLSHFSKINNLAYLIGYIPGKFYHLDHDKDSKIVLLKLMNGDFIANWPLASFDGNVLKFDQLWMIPCEVDDYITTATIKKKLVRMKWQNREPDNDFFFFLNKFWVDTYVKWKNRV